MDGYKFFGAQRLLTMTFKVEGTGEPQSFTFRPEKVNVLPDQLIAFLKANKKEGSRRRGGQKITPIDEWFDAGLLWELTPDQARNLIETRRPPQPLDPTAGQNKHSHTLAEIPGQTAAEKEVADRIMGASASSSIPVDTIVAPNIDLPPSPVAT